MSQDELDPVIHVPARLRIMVTLATLPEGDNLSFTRLQDLIGLTPGNLITHLRKLEDAGYIRTEKTGSGVTARTSVSLTHEGRARTGPLHHRAAATAGPGQFRRGSRRSISGSLILPSAASSASHRVLRQP